MHDEQTDEQLFEHWRAGDEAAGAVLVTRHYDSIARFFAYRLGPDSEDQVQETFVGLQRSLHSFRGDCSVRIYLFKIARKQLLMTLRNRVRDRARFDPGEASVADIAPTPSALLAASDDLKLLVAALRYLPVDVQIMLELHYWEQLKILEIAEVLDMKINTVKARMRRGRIRLQEEMERLAESSVQLQTSLNRISGWIEELRARLDDVSAVP